MSIGTHNPRGRPPAASDEQFIAAARRLVERGIYPSSRRLGEATGMSQQSAMRRIDTLDFCGRWPFERKVPCIDHRRKTGSFAAKDEAVLEAARALVASGIYPSCRRISVALGPHRPQVRWQVRRLKAAGRWPKDVPSVRSAAPKNSPDFQSSRLPRNITPDPTPWEIREATIAIRKANGTYVEPLQRWETR